MPRRVSSAGRKDVDSSWESIETAVDDAEGADDLQAAAPKFGMVESSTQTDECKKLAVARKPARPVQRGFWSAVYEALDSFSDDLHER
jgi:hypothetical protein